MADITQFSEGIRCSTGDIDAAGGALHARTTVKADAGITAGVGLTVTSGATALLGTIVQAGIAGSVQGGTGAAVTFTTGAIINPKLPTGACTTAILAPGTVNGQLIIVSNLAQNATFTITFDVPATSNVWDDGTNPQVIKAGTAKMFYWDTSINTTGAWVAFAPYAG